MKDKYLEFYKTNFGTAKYCTKSWGLASFEAGAQSRQAEIDELVDMVKTSADSEMYLYDELQRVSKDRDELQKKIDAHNEKLSLFIDELKKTHSEDMLNKMDYWRGFSDCAETTVKVFYRDVGVVTCKE